MYATGKHTHTHTLHIKDELSSCCFKLSQPQKVTSGLETNVIQPPTCSAQSYETTNSSKSTKNSLNTNIKDNIQTSSTIFRRNGQSDITPV